MIICRGSQLPWKKSDHPETAMLWGSPVSHGEVFSRMRCCVCGVGRVGRPRCIKAVDMNEDASHLGRETAAPVMLADITWVRDEPPSWALPEFLTHKIRKLFQASKWRVIYCGAKDNQNVAYDPEIAFLFFLYRQNSHTAQTRTWQCWLWWQRVRGQRGKHGRCKPRSPSQ